MENKTSTIKEGTAKANFVKSSWIKKKQSKAMSPLRQSIHEIKGKFESYVAYYVWLPQFDVCLMLKINNPFFYSGLFIPSLSPPGSSILLIATMNILSYTKYPSIKFSALLLVLERKWFLYLYEDKRFKNYVSIYNVSPFGDIGMFLWVSKNNCFMKGDKVSVQMHFSKFF